MFSVVSQFSFPVYFIGLEGFSPGSYFPLIISRSIELVFEEKSNCNNVTFRAERFQSGSHVTTNIQNFTLVSLSSIMMPHLVKLPSRAAVPSLPTYSTSYALVSLRI